VHDPVPEALEKGTATIRGHIERGVERGRIDAADGRAAIERLHAAGSLDQLKDAELVIEAAPENLELKRKLFGELEATVVSPECVLATNTSSLLVTAVASGLAHPERV